MAIPVVVSISMTQTGTVLMAIVLVVGSIGIVPAAAFTGVQADQPAVADPVGQVQINNSTSSLPPGSLLSGVVGIQEAELESNVERGAFGLRIAKAASERAKADIVEEQLNESQHRLQALQNRLEELKESRENGTISNGTFAARAVPIQAQLNTLQQIGEDIGNVSQRLPTEVLEAVGVNVTAINTLRTKAATMTGPEVAAIAQKIAGPKIGGGPPPFVNATRGPPGFVGPPIGNGTVGPGGDAGPPFGNETSGPGAGNQTSAGEQANDNRTTSGDSGSDSSDGNQSGSSDRGSESGSGSDGISSGGSGGARP